MPKPARRRRDDDADDDNEDEQNNRRHRRSRARDDDDEDRPRRRGRRGGGIPPGTPRVYVHKKCGRHTEMPADVIRTYLDNPFAFGHQTICSYCDKEVPWEKCEWEETEENLLDYFEDLQARALLAGNDQRENEQGKGMIWIGPITGLVILGVVGALVGHKIGLTPFLGGLLGAVAGIGFGFIQFYREHRAYEQTKEEYDRKLFKSFYARHPEEQRRKVRR